MDRLAARWNRKLEAQAVANEYRAAKCAQDGQSILMGRTVSAPIDAAETWQSFYHTFHTLADEELQLEPHNVNDRWLRAYASYDDQSSECGLWSLSDGVNEGFKARFEVAATRAGIALNLPLLNRPLHVWL